MNDPTSENILKKTFDYLEEVLEEHNHQIKTGTDEQLNEKENSNVRERNKQSEAIQDDCCSS